MARLYPVSTASGSLKIERSAGSGSCDRTKSPVLDAIEASLSRIARYTVTTDGLNLLDDRSEPVLALSRITADGLENKEWSIDQYYDGTRLVPATAESQITLVNNFVDGTPGCGAFDGNYILSGTLLKISASVILGGCCPDDLWSQSGVIARAISGERTIERDGQRLVLRDGQGTIQVILRP